MTEQLQRKADLLAVGAYPTSKGYVIRLRDMNDYHLVHALIKAVESADPDMIVRPLAKEVVRRGLRGLALDTVEHRR